MRLTCPNCDAEYAVDDAAIPPTGRDVQCSNCGHGWFQLPAAILAQPEAGLDLPEDQFSGADASDDGSAPIPRRPIDEGLLAILREEAEREAAARRAEAGVIEVQTEMGLMAPAAMAAETGGLAGVAAQRAADEPPRVAPVTPVRAPVASRRVLLPEIEEINSSLKAKDRAAERGPDVAARAAAQRGAFRSGFVLVLVIAALGLATYATAPKLAEQMPSAKPMLERYVAAVDEARLRLDAGMRQTTLVVRDLTAKIANSTGG